jgi:hypothetical protein
MLSFAIAFECFELIPGWEVQVGDTWSEIQLVEFAPS